MEGRLVLSAASWPRELEERTQCTCKEPLHILFSVVSAHLVSKLPFLHASQCLLLADSFTILEPSL